MIEYVDTIQGITTELLHGFFVGWPDPPSPETHLKILSRSTHIVLAVEKSTGRVVGFINALSDGVLTAYIPLLEVLPEFQKQGIGRELVTRILARLGRLYMIDLLCDKDLEPFYTHFGLRPVSGMARRNYDHQSGQE